jgi:hypothetical protein
MEAHRRETGDLLGRLPPDYVPHDRACESVGLVRYATADKAWELTPAGNALLERAEATR